jgi:hypothetical protein
MIFCFACTDYQKGNFVLVTVQTSRNGGISEHSFQVLTLAKQTESLCKGTQFQGSLAEFSVVCINRITCEVGKKKGKNLTVSVGNEAGWIPRPVWMTWRSENS